MSSDNVDVQGALAAFKVRINVKGPRRNLPSSDDDDCCKEALPVSTNIYFSKGAAFQASKKMAGKSDAPIRKKAKNPWVESHLHEAIRDNPFLLHTPELYAGGLYMEAIIDKLQLPFGLVTDFCYITVQTRTIKITLVEIEQAAKKVFHNPLPKRNQFQCKAEEAVCQVRDWQSGLRRSSAREEMLARLRHLFHHYPLELFDQDGKPLSTTKIDIGYVLVVGNEMPTHQAHQDLIDNLYINEGIIFMTYPMMLTQVEASVHHKNTLTVGVRKTTIETIHRPDALGTAIHWVGGQLFPSLPEDDTYGVRLAGLGHYLGSKYASVHNPADTKKLVYRSAGVCEMPGCCNAVVSGGTVTGSISAIYDPRLDYTQVFERYRLGNVALICDQHPGGTHSDFKWAYESDLPHPMTTQLMDRGPYSPDLDRAATDWVASWVRDVPDALANALELTQGHHPELYRQVVECALSLRSLPPLSRSMLWQISLDYYGNPFSHFDRSADLAKHPSVEYLLRAGLVRVNSLEKPGKEIEPAIFSRELIDHCYQIFSTRSLFGFFALFAGSPQRVVSEVARARNQSLPQQKISHP